MSKELKTKSKLFANKLNGEALNSLNTVSRMPFAKKRIYVTSHNFDGQMHFFDSEEELLKFYDANLSNIDLSMYAYDYIGKFAGQKDVIRVVDRAGNFTLFTAYDEDGYLMLDTDNTKQISWKYTFCNKHYVKALYEKFKQSGITLENDVYGKIVKTYKRILRVAR